MDVKVNCKIPLQVTMYAIPERFCDGIPFTKKRYYKVFKTSTFSYKYKDNTIHRNHISHSQNRPHTLFSARFAR